MVTTRGNGGHVHPGPSAHASELRFASDISFRVRRGIPPDHASASTAQRATPSPPVFSAPGVEPIVLERDSSDEESYGSPYDRSIHHNSKRTRSEEVSLGRTPPPPPSRSQAHTTRPKLTTFHANGKRTRSSGLLDSEREVQSLKVPRTTTTTTPLSASLEQSVLLSVRVPSGSAEAMCSKGRRSTRSPDALKKRSRDSMNALSLYDTPTKGHRGSLLGAQKRPKRG